MNNTESSGQGTIKWILGWTQRGFKY